MKIFEWSPRFAVDNGELHPLALSDEFRDMDPLLRADVLRDLSADVRKLYEEAVDAMPGPGVAAPEEAPGPDLPGKES